MQILSKLKLLLIAGCLSASLLAGAAEPNKVNINTATAEEFSSLNGVGKAKAEAIIAYRTEIGEFKSIDEITMVKGIGPAILDKNKDRISLE